MNKSIENIEVDKDLAFSYNHNTNIPMNKNRQNFLGYVNEEEIKIGIDTSQEQLDNLPSKKELKNFLSKGIGILKEHKGLVLVEVADHEGDHIKITL